MVKHWVAGLAVVIAIGGEAAAAPSCTGDCGGDDGVSVAELVTAVRLALGGTDPATDCVAADENADGAVDVAEVVTAVDNSLEGCPSFAGDFAGAVVLDAGRSATLALSTESDGSASGTATIREAGAGKGGGSGVAAIALLGTVDLDTGAFTVTGSYVEQGETVEVGASGVLPLRNTGAGTFTFALGDQGFDGSIAAEGGLVPTPTPSPSPTLAAATPTATATRASDPTPTFPTPPPGCEGGFARATFSDVSSDINANQPLDSLDLAKADVNLSVIGTVSVIGGALNKCPAELVPRLVDFGVIQEGPITAGTVFRLNESPGGLLPKNRLDYREVTLLPSQQLWSAVSGTLTVVAIDGNVVTIRVSNARMVPGARFPLGPPAMGTFTLDLEGTITVVRL